jgi:3-hydroxyisobutyrate dehydrogenase-like beta-hydroxyacid dehydrogenase
MPSPSVGIIGLGIMGSAISANLVRDGFRVVGYDVLVGRRDVHRRAGGTVARSCREVARRATLIVTSLPSSQSLLDTADELVRGAQPNQIVIETSTLTISVKEEARARLASHGITLLDCPLSGTGAQARDKDLVVYASGSRSAYRRAIPVIDGFARAHHYVGAFGAGSRMKFVANLLVAIHNVAAAEALVLAMKAGLDPATVLKVVADGAGTSRMLEVRGPMMVKGDYADATMTVEAWQKDLTLIGDFARALECPTPLFAASGSIYAQAMAMGLGSEDTASVCAVLDDMANNRRGRRRQLEAVAP